MLRNPAEVVAFVAERADEGRGGVLTASRKPPINVFVMDLWCYVPYYDRYLCQSLAGEGIATILGSVSPYQDPEYFRRNGVANDPGLIDLVSKLRISNDNIRRALMLVECCINMAVLLARFAVSKPDIVHVQWIPMVRRFPFEMWFLSLVRRMGIKLIYTVHNLLPHDTGQEFMPLFRRVYAKMDGLICHTEEAKRKLVSEFSIDPEQIWVIPHGPLFHDAKCHSTKESKAALSLRPDETVVLCQGIIRPYKGLDFLLQSWHKVQSKNLNARLVIAGTGEPDLLEAIKKRVHRLGLQESVRLDLRFIPDEQLVMYYEAADVVVYPYREVTASGALMTAVAFGKSIVATNLPAFRQVLRDKETALLVDYDDAEALAGFLTLLIGNPKERERLAANLASSDDFDSWSSIARRTRQCYASLLREMRGEAVS